MTAVHALNEQDILKAGRCDEDHSRTLALKQRVDPQCCSQHDRAGVFDLESRFANDADQGFDRILGGGGKLSYDEVARGIVHSDQIGKSATGINTASNRWTNW